MFHFVIFFFNLYLFNWFILYVLSCRKHSRRWIRTAMGTSAVLNLSESLISLVCSVLVYVYTSVHYTPPCRLITCLKKSPSYVVLIISWVHQHNIFHNLEIYANKFHVWIASSIAICCITFQISI